MIVSFLNEKGGVGKSTLSVNVAAYLAKKPRKVLLIDADTQGTVAAWAALREDSKFRVVSMAVTIWPGTPWRWRWTTRT